MKSFYNGYVQNSFIHILLSYQIFLYKIDNNKISSTQTNKVLQRFFVFRLVNTKIINVISCFILDTPTYKLQSENLN